MNRLATILRLVALSAAIVAVFIYLTARKHFAGKAEEFQRIETVYEQTQKELQEAALTIQA
ncbi:MAG: hypothetical protein L7T19_04925, partial [Pseudomonadales bacterium]|nr:hypothetical protein [Pseudomonadales bacterium]